MSTKKPVLFERIDGEQVIAKLIHQFYDRVVADPELQPFFKDTSMDKLRRMQREFFSAALDGPITYFTPQHTLSRPDGDRLAFTLAFAS